MAWERAEPAMLHEPLAQALALPDRPSIAVLPLLNLSGDPTQDYFVDGGVVDILAALLRMRWLFVIARNSSFTYKGRSVEGKHVGRELGGRRPEERRGRNARASTWSSCWGPD